jgi:hypothetical protein
MKQEKLTLETVKTLFKQDNLREAVKNYLVYRAKAELLKPKVAEIYNGILAKYDFKEDLNYKHSPSSGKRITNYERLYLSKGDVKKYYSETNDALSAIDWGFKFPRTHCPYLVMHTKQIEAENIILKIVVEAFAFPEVWDMKLRQAIIDLTIRASFTKE